MYFIFAHHKFYNIVEETISGKCKCMLLMYNNIIYTILADTSD